MDLNTLYFQHQIAVMASTGAATADRRSAGRDRAESIARRIETIQTGTGAAAAQTWSGGWRADGHWMPGQAARHDASKSA